MASRCERCGESLEAEAHFCGLCGAPIGDPNLGRVIGGRYVLRERIGAGVLGIVYRAEQQIPRRAHGGHDERRLGSGRKLAIKLLAADPHRNPEELEARFRREGELRCQLRSAHTITTYEYDRDADGSLYIAMELSPGRSLADVLRLEGPLGWPRVLRILAGLCDALAEAHALGVVHRDLKPENILLESRPGNSDFARLLDFGLAKLLTPTASVSSTAQTIAEVAFSSPEQLLRRPIDARSDIYGLGVLGYLLVTGRHPFADARSLGDLVEAHVRRVPAPVRLARAGLPGEVEVLLARCLDKDPERRFPDTSALAAIIGVALAGLPPETGATLREPDLGEEATLLAEPPRKP
jgi:eukaryotic-like serine/threonine-protein kinase